MNGFRATLRRSWPVLLSYGIFSVWGVACLVMSLVLTSGGFGVEPGDLGVLAGVLIATVVGHVGGNVLGLLGLRLMPVTLFFLALFVGATMSGLALGAFALFLLVAVFSALGGYLGVASRLDVVAAWYPLSFCVGGAIVWMNRHGAVDTFASGAKHGVWDGFTLLCLSGGVFLMLVFLATRHSLGLTVWQEVARPRGLAVAEEQIAVARPGRGSFFVLFVFTIAVLGTTALVSPYLFRTHEHDGKDGQSSSSGGGGSGEDPAPTKQGDKGTSSGSGHGDETDKGTSSGKGGGHAGSGGSSGAGGSSGKGTSSGKGASSGKGTSSGNGGGHAGSSGSSGGASGESSGSDSDDPLGSPDADRAGDAAGEALALGMKLFVWLLVAVAALLVFLLVIVPPIRRVFLLRHLERPLWPVAPTARVMNLWRRALATLAVVDIEPSAGETPRDFARRARDELQGALGCDASGLEAAAGIVEKIDYAGRGLGAGDEQTMREAIQTFVGTVSRHLGFRQKLGAAWGRAPDVEP